MSRYYTCRVCNAASGHKTYIVKEMMFGLKEEFLYFECCACGSLQISEVPHDMAKYYPKNYPSLIERPDLKIDINGNFLKRYLRSKRNRYASGGKSWIGYLANSIRPAEDSLVEILSWFHKRDVTFEAKILDVGCGNGSLMQRLSQAGFNNLTGIDPYIEQDFAFSGHAKIFKKDMSDIDMKFDVIMLNHSLEHMKDPVRALQDIARLLNKSGHVLIRTPLVPSYSWQHYREAWVQLDAPRHNFIFSVKGINILAQKSGLIVKEVMFDSTEFQFIGSEQCLRGISLFDKRSYLADTGLSIFSKRDLKLYKEKARELNRRCMGDQGAIHVMLA